VCARQVQKLRASFEKFEEAGAKVIAILPHEIEYLELWDELAGHKFPVLADPGFLVSSTYGVAFQMRIHTNTSNTPAVFLVGKNGLLKWEYIAQDEISYNDRPKIETILEKIAHLETIS
jgi:peroxiredoxin